MTPASGRRGAVRPTVGGVRIATRASDLARWQAEHVRARLLEIGIEGTLVLVETDADRSSAPIPELGVGVFTKAVQQALVDGRADIAVHSFKDLPSRVDPRLELAAVPPRGPAHDVLVVRDGFDPAAEALPLAPGARVGTGAARRRAQLLEARPDLDVRGVRGNVPTRIEKLRSGAFDALVLAAAGLERLQLDLEGLRRFDLGLEVMLPAPAQGALAIEVRRDDPLGGPLTDLHDVAGYATVAAERGLMTMLEAGCQLALGAYAERDGDLVHLRAFFEGRRVSVRHGAAEGASMLALTALRSAAPEGALP